MLALTRKKGEEVVIGTGDGEIRLIVKRIQGQRVTLGFEAPEAIGIHRRELYDRIHEGPHDD